MDDIACTTVVAAASPGPDLRNFEKEQTREHLQAIGHSLPEQSIADLHNHLRKFRPYKSYELYAAVPFMYEILNIDGWTNRVKDLVDLWVQDNSNIQRAAMRVGRQPAKSEGLLRGYCVFRLKEFDGDEWTSAQDSLGMDKTEPQTVVFIALEDLGAFNGFFMALPRGNDVCLDSRSKPRFPSSGGGFGIFIALDL